MKQTHQFSLVRTMAIAASLVFPAPAFACLGGGYHVDYTTIGIAGIIVIGILVGMHMRYRKSPDYKPGTESRGFKILSLGIFGFAFIVWAWILTH